MANLFLFFAEGFMSPNLWYGLLLAAIFVALIWYRGRMLQMNIPRVGPKPSIFGNTSKGQFYSNSAGMVEEGYQKVSIRIIFHII
jgi:hypothetical protein